MTSTVTKSSTTGKEAQASLLGPFAGWRPGPRRSCTRPERVQPGFRASRAGNALVSRLQPTLQDSLRSAPNKINQRKDEEDETANQSLLLHEIQLRRPG
jgi:hypothetical protein